jgi:nucleoid DNA-binding protein
MNTTKHDLVAAVARETGLTQAEIKIVVEEFLEAVAEELERERTIEFRGFGTFLVKERAPRPARNPRTGEVVQLAKRMAVLFKYSSELKERIMEGPR